MARLGKRPVEIPDGVKVKIEDNKIIIEGPKGKLEKEILPYIEVEIADNKIYVKNIIPEKNKKLYKKGEAFQGLMRSLIENMVIGVKDGYEKVLEIHGVGYKGEVKGKKLVLALGFSHPVEVDIPGDISVEVARNTVIFIRGIDKQKVGNFAASVRKIYPPEPYKGKGIRYRGEYVRHKAGKAAVGAGQ